jgi:hypothetical protein
MTLILYITSAQAQPVSQTYTDMFDSLYQYIDFSSVSPRLIYDRVVPFAGLHYFNSTSSDTSSCSHFIQAYSELYRAALPGQNDLPISIDSLKNVCESFPENIVMLGLINSFYSFIDTNAYHDGRLYQDHGFWFQTTGSWIFNRDITLIFSPLSKTARGPNIDFLFSNDFVFGNNQMGSIDSIFVDFADGQGFIPLLLNSVNHVSYSSFGEKILKFRIKLNGYWNLLTFARMIVAPPLPQFAPTDLPTPIIDTIIAQIPYQGTDEAYAYYGKANMYVYKNSNHAQVVKPIVVVDGFDPQDKRSAHDVWDLFMYNNNQGFASNIGIDLSNLGYDIIIVNMEKYIALSGNGHFKFVDGGSDYIQRNAFTMIEVINTINNMLAAANSTHEIVVVGPSMGGQITRYALAYMEQHANDPKCNYGKHNCRLWVSFDSPHVGANIAYGGQAFLHYFGKWSEGEDAKQKFNEILNTPAAKQMLQLHISDPNRLLHTSYYQDIDNLGYPNQLRKIAISNGSLNATPTGYDHQLALTIHSSVCIADIRNITAGNDNQNDDHVLYSWFGGGIVTTYRKRFGTGCGNDAAPGGTYNTYEQIYESTMESLISEIKPANIYTHSLNLSSHCFMPTYSTLGYWNGWQNSCQDLWQNGNRDLVAEGNTPFASYWGPINKNMKHVSFDSDLVAFLLNEIETYIQGPRAIQTCVLQTYSVHLPSGQGNATVNWTCSNNLHIVSGQGTPTVIIQASSVGEGWIEAAPSNLQHNQNLNRYKINITPGNLSLGIPASYVINQNATWAYPMQVLQDVTINSPCTLTITSTMYCASNSSFIVEPGAKLIIDGGILTNACDGDMWKGIQVVGTANQRQYGVTTSTGGLHANPYQGVILLKNNAVIEHAKIGIATGRYNDNGTLVSNTAGGIISASRATFRNNGIAVKFDPYQWASNSNATPLNNMSSFKFCTFITDENNLFSGNGVSFVQHARLHGVRNLAFYGCTFSSSTSGNGIYAEDAGFTIDRTCDLPDGYAYIGSCPSFAYPTFTGFTQAIVAGVVSGQRGSTEIYNTTFSNNLTAVSFNNLNNFTLQNNHVQFVNNNSAIGFNLSGCTGYTIKDNEFTRPGLPMLNYAYGIYIYNSGTAENLINRNTFTGTYIGISCGGTNGINSTTALSGLQFACNEFSLVNLPIYSSGLIRLHQGSNTRGADNIFYPRAESGGMIWGNEFTTSQYLNYFYSPGNYHALTQYSSTITPVGNATANPCTDSGSGNLFTLMSGAPSATGGSNNNNTGILSRDIADLSQPEALAQYRKMQQQYKSMQQSYEQAGYEEVLQEHARLGGNTRQMDSKTAALVAKAGAAAHALSQMSLDMNDLSNTAIHRILTDSTGTSNSIDLRAWYNEIDHACMKYILAENYMQDADPADAMTAIADLPARYRYDDLQAAEHDNYLRLQNLQSTLIGAGRTWEEASENEKILLQDIADFGDGRSSVMARDILCFFFNTCHELKMPELDKKPKNLANQLGNTDLFDKEGTILVYPNPARDELKIDLSDGSPANAGLRIENVQILDLTGRIMVNDQLSTNNTINISRLSAGMYILRATTEKSVEVVRFVKK